MSCCDVKLYGYQECLEAFGTRSRIDALVRSGELFRIETGIYADSPDVPDVDILLKRYPGSILTMESAYYYHDLSDKYSISSTLRPDGTVSA